ncbi:MAG: hypothetical protein PWP09_1004 [Thermotogota bacterium]|nr:hypothetical protein [Thermotogota bacterium]
MKSGGSTAGLRLKLPGLSAAEGDGIAGVGVKSVDIGKNAGGEAGLLGCY